jgi:uncharacterized membrane protein
MNATDFFRVQPVTFRLATFLFLALAWSIFLVAGRIIFTASLAYGFLLWNLILAVLPLVFSSLLSLKTSLPWRFAAATFWILFFPNAPYIITDFIHLQHLRGAPPWFDALMLTSCAGTGLAFGYASVMQVHHLLHRAQLILTGHIVILATFFLAGFGIYLGRFLRWNSMDILQSPFLLFSDIADRLFHPISHPRTWGVTLGFGIFLSLGYGFLAALTRGYSQFESLPSRKAY